MEIAGESLALLEKSGIDVQRLKEDLDSAVMGWDSLKAVLPSVKEVIKDMEVSQELKLKASAAEFTLRVSSFCDELEGRHFFVTESGVDSAYEEVAHVRRELGVLEAERAHTDHLTTIFGCSEVLVDATRMLREALQSLVKIKGLWDFVALANSQVRLCLGGLCAHATTHTQTWMHVHMRTQERVHTRARAHTQGGV